MRFSYQGGIRSMGAQNHLKYLYEPKSIPKQIPLFEEQDDGNLIPYEREN